MIAFVTMKLIVQQRDSCTYLFIYFNFWFFFIYRYDCAGYRCHNRSRRTSHRRRRFFGDQMHRSWNNLVPLSRILERRSKSLYIMYKSLLVTSANCWFNFTIEYNIAVSYTRRNRRWHSYVHISTTRDCSWRHGIVWLSWLSFRSYIASSFQNIRKCGVHLCPM